MSDTTRQLLTDLARAGVSIKIDGDALRLSPRKALTPSLLWRVQALKPALRELVGTSTTTNTPPNDSATGGIGYGDSNSPVGEARRSRAAAESILAELARVGISAHVDGGSLRLRPRKALTPELLARVERNKSALLALLATTTTNTPTHGSASGGLCLAQAFSADEAELPHQLPAKVRTVVDQLKRAFGRVDLVEVGCGPPLTPIAAWIEPDARPELPRDIVDLIRKRQGWTAASWRRRLLHLANVCESRHASRAADLRRAAAEMLVVRQSALPSSAPRR